jgi:hypothetical protein
MTEERAAAAWAQLKAWLIDLSKIIVAVGIVGGALLAGTRYALRDYIPLPELVAELAGTGREVANQLATIEARLAGANAPPPIVEYQHEAYVLPAAASPGQDVRVVYYQRRNVDCETMIERRFFSVGEAQYDDQTVLRQAETTAPVTPQYLIWSRRLTVPVGLAPGHYLYHPVLRCAGYPAVAAPPALFEVTDDEARWRGRESRG